MIGNQQNEVAYDLGISGRINCGVVGPDGPEGFQLDIEEAVKR
jgi:hypothetical protein